MAPQPLVMLARSGDTIHDLTPSAQASLTPGDEATARCGAALGRVTTLARAAELAPGAHVCQRCTALDAGVLGDDEADELDAQADEGEPEDDEPED